MSQRVAIAMAIAAPKVVIADEPTTALDVTIQAQIMELLLNLQRDQDMALILITHDLAVVAETAQRVCVMYAGEAVEIGGVPALFDRPTHPYTEALIKAIPEHCAGEARLPPYPASFRALRPPARLPAVATLPLCPGSIAARSGRPWRRTSAARCAASIR